MCLGCADADIKKEMKEGEFCLGSVPFAELVRDLIDEYKLTGRTIFNILKDAVPDRPVEKLLLKTPINLIDSVELSISFV